MIKKILICIALSFLISFSSLYVFQISTRSYVDVFRLQDEFYAQEFSSQKKILILGSSEIATLNNTYINNYISKNGHNSVIYNLAIASDMPSERLESIHNIISTKPEIVVYGIGFRDFANRYSLIQTQTDKPNTELPNLQKLFFSPLLKHIEEFYDIKSPKFVTYKVLNTIINNFTDLESNEKLTTANGNMPFFIQSSDSVKIRNEVEIRTHFKQSQSLGLFDSVATNSEIIALKKIISQLQENDIQVVLFTTPHANVFFENLNPQNKQVFNDALEDISAQYKIKIIRLENKYGNLNIWNDYYHIAYNQTALVYSEDVAKLILNQIEINQSG